MTYLPPPPPVGSPLRRGRMVPRDNRFDNSCVVVFLVGILLAAAFAMSGRPGAAHPGCRCECHERTR